MGGSGYGPDWCLPHRPIHKALIDCQVGNYFIMGTQPFPVESVWFRFNVCH